MKYELPAALSAVGLAAAEPHLAATAGVAIGLFSVVRGVRQARRARQTANPAAYLLEVQKQLAPEHALARMGRMLGVVSGKEPHY